MICNDTLLQWALPNFVVDRNCRRLKRKIIKFEKCENPNVDVILKTLEKGEATLVHICSFAK